MKIDTMTRSQQRVFSGPRPNVEDALTGFEGRDLRSLYGGDPAE